MYHSLYIKPSNISLPKHASTPMQNTSKWSSSKQVQHPVIRLGFTQLNAFILNCKLIVPFCKVSHLLRQQIPAPYPLLCKWVWSQSPISLESLFPRVYELSWGRSALYFFTETTGKKTPGKEGQRQKARWLQHSSFNTCSLLAKLP